MKQRIVVGIDGSKGARRALLWALDEARRRQATLDVVHVWFPPPIYWGDLEHKVRIREENAKRAQEVISSEIAEVAVDHEGIEVNAALIEGNPSERLIDCAKDADLLVVGTRGHGGFTGLALGAISNQVIHHAICPVVVVPDTNRFR